MDWGVLDLYEAVTYLYNLDFSLYNLDFSSLNVFWEKFSSSCIY